MNDLKAQLNGANINHMDRTNLGLEKRAPWWLLASCSVLLLLTALAKLHAVFWRPLLLLSPNPVFPFMTNRGVIASASVVEIFVALYIFFSKDLLVRSGALLSLSCAFLVYRLALHRSGLATPCFCLGLSSKLVPLTATIQNLVLKGILGYFLCVSLGLLLYAWPAYCPRGKADPLVET